MARELTITLPGDTSTLYAIIRRKSDAKVWSVTNSAFETWANGSIGDYDVALTSRGGDYYDGDFPTGISAGTRVIIQYYAQLGGAPAITDTLKLTVESTWSGAELASASSVSLDSRALTTLASAKRHLRITSSADDTLLTELINQVSDRIEREVGRRFAAANYIEVHFLEDDAKISVRNWPVIRVDRVRYSLEDTISLSYGGSDIEAAAGVYTDEEGNTGYLRMVSTSAAGTTTTNDLAFATYPTLSTLVTAADAISGWTVTRTAGLDAAATCLPMQAMTDCKNTTGYLQGFTETDYAWGLVKPRTGTIATACGWGRVQVFYRGGYETVPDDVARVANELVEQAYNSGKHDSTLTSESIPDYSYTLASGVELTDRHRRMLAPYIAYAVGGVA